MFSTIPKLANNDGWKGKPFWPFLLHDLITLPKASS